MIQNLNIFVLLIDFLSTVRKYQLDLTNEERILKSENYHRIIQWSSQAILYFYDFYGPLFLKTFEVAINCQNLFFRS